jgi:ABC-type transporter Mla maintaining outer membrane lipid asymmetry ATPase subunit MlaF
MSHRLLEVLQRLYSESQVCAKQTNATVCLVKNIFMIIICFDDYLIFKDVSLKIYPGEITAILGHNGAGMRAFIYFCLI